MLQSSDSFNPKAGTPASNPNAYNPIKTVTAPVDQATIGRTLVIKGEISGSEALYIDGRIEGKITMPESRVTIGRNGKIDASMQAREVVVMGKVTGNIECSDRVDIRAEGSVHGDISTRASAWKMAPRSRAGFRSAAAKPSTKISRTTPSQPRLPKPWLPPPARNWRDDLLVKDKGHACACPLSFRGCKMLRRIVRTIW